MAFNPMQMMQMMMGGKGMNPMQMMMNQLNGNPLFQQAQNMAQGKSPEQLKQTCENLCRQKGVDFNAAWNQFQSQFPGMK
jgi:hypothetical protein